MGKGDVWLGELPYICTDRSGRACGVGDCTCQLTTIGGLGDTSRPRIDRIPPTRPPWRRRQFRELKKIIFSAPSTCPIDLFGPVANGRILKRLQCAFRCLLVSYSPLASQNCEPVELVRATLSNLIHLQTFDHLSLPCWTLVLAWRNANPLGCRAQRDPKPENMWGRRLKRSGRRKRGPTSFSCFYKRLPGAEGPPEG